MRPVEELDDDELLEEFARAVKAAHYSPMGMADDLYDRGELEDEILARMRR